MSVNLCFLHAPVHAWALEAAAADLERLSAAIAPAVLQAIAKLALYCQRWLEADAAEASGWQRDAAGLAYSGAANFGRQRCTGGLFQTVQNNANAYAARHGLKLPSLQFGLLEERRFACARCGTPMLTNGHPTQPSEG